MLRNLFYTLVILFCWSVSERTYCQQIQFAKKYFTSGDHGIYSFVELSDSGYFLAGYSSLAWNVNDDSSFVMRLNKYGDTLFTRKYMKGFFSDIVNLDDSTVITTLGFYPLHNHGVHTMQLNVNNGDTLIYWEYDTAQQADYSFAIKRCLDNGYLLLCASTYYGLLKINVDGLEQWHRTATMGVYDATIDSAGNRYIVCGIANPLNTPYKVLCINDTGGTIWENHYGINPSFYHYEATSVIVMQDSNYLVSTDGTDWHLMKLDRNNGDTLWTRITYPPS